MQGQQRNVQKKLDARAELLFCSLNLLLFWCSPCRSRSSFVGSLLESWSNDLFERRTSTVCLDASKFALLSVFMLIETIYQKKLGKTTAHYNAKSPLPVDMRRSKTSDVALIAVTCFKSSLKKYRLILAKNGNSRSPWEEHQCIVGTVATFYLNILRYLKKIIHPIGNIADCACEYGRTSI